MIILLNGTSSAGKTTLARAIQAASDDLVLHFGFDHLFFSIHPRFVGTGELSHLGYQFLPQEDGTLNVHIGTKGQQISRAKRRAIRAMADEGLSIVIDDLLLSPTDYEDYCALFDEFLTVAVKPPVEIAEERES